MLSERVILLNPFTSKAPDFIDTGIIPSIILGITTLSPVPLYFTIAPVESMSQRLLFQIAFSVIFDVIGALKLYNSPFSCHSTNVY